MLILDADKSTFTNKVFSMSRITYLIFAILLMLTGNVFAQSKIEVELAINSIPQDGLVFQQISIGSLRSELKNKNISDCWTKRPVGKICLAAENDRCVDQAESMQRGQTVGY